MPSMGTATGLITDFDMIEKSETRPEDQPYTPPLLITKSHAPLSEPLSKQNHSILKNRVTSISATPSSYLLLNPTSSEPLSNVMAEDGPQGPASFTELGMGGKDHKNPYPGPPLPC
ncbi:hypothetical protein FXO38_33915 [Capsicum annuum]|nr:hypothetical protein FXO38_33915 [Capsicum annuum]KAF3653685.1 hypothetical protein FXO37_16838 [Capsicum annuum]